MKLMSVPKARRKLLLTIAVIPIATLLLIPVAISSFIFVKCPAREIPIPLQDHTTTIKGLQVYYRTAGDVTQQPLVFLHGWGSRLDGRCGTDAVIAELAKSFYVIAPEHPGLIRSEPPKEIWNFDQYAEVVDQLLRDLHVQQPIIMGQSFGGGVATAFANKHSQEFKALVLVDASMSNMPLNFYRRWWRRGAATSEFLLRSRFTPSLLKKSIANLYFGVPFASMDDLPLTERAIMPLIDRKKSLNVDYSAIVQPVVMVWGDKDQFTTPLSRAKQTQAEMPRSELTVVQGTHTVLYQRPDEIVPLIIHKLEQL